MLIKFPFYLLCFLLATISLVSHAAPGDIEVIHESEHLKRIKINNQQYNDLFETDVMNISRQYSQQSVSAASAARTNESVVVHTLRGVLEAGFPRWLEDEFLEDAGFTDWSEVSEEQLNTPIDRTVIDIDALREVSQLNGVNLMGIVTTSNVQLNSDIDVTPQGWFCGKKWKNKENVFTRQIDKKQEKLASYNKNGIDAGLNGLYEGKGTFKAGIYYKVKTRCGIPYKAEFVRAAIDVDAVVKGQMGLDGYAKYKYEDNTIKHQIPLWSYKDGWWVYFFQFELELDLNMDVGVDLKVEAATAFKTTHEVGGTAKVSWTCTRDKCQKTRNDVNFNFNLVEKQNYSAQVRVEVTPYVDTNFAADLDMYYGAIQLAKAKVGIVAALPVTLFGYYGNMCSDANGDGQNEYVDALLMDVTAQIYGYLKVQLGSKAWLADLKINVAGWDVHDKQITLYTEKDFKPTIFTKNLYYKDFISGGSSVMEPAMNLPAIVKTEGAIILSSRSCYPFQDALTYEIDWGDGSPNYIGAGGRISHNWLRNGNTTVRARLLSDAADRSFVERWTEKRVNVSPDGIAPTYPWLVPVLSLLLH